MEKSFYKGTQRYSFQYEPDPNDSNPASSFTFRDEEQVRVRYYYPYIQKGSVVFDVGASFGSYTLPALALGATVVAFSPEHEYPLIKKNIEMNDFLTYSVCPFGLYSQEGYFNTDTTEFSEKDRGKENEGKWTGWWIFVTTLDKFNTLPSIDFIKLDTEGAELEVLKGGINTIKEYKPKMLIELHIFKDKDIEDKIKDFLKPLDYKIKTQPYTPAISHMLCWI